MRAQASPTMPDPVSARAETAPEDRVISTDVMAYCVSAIPAPYVESDELIIRDASGRAFLLSSESRVPVPLGQSELNLLGMVYEPAQDSSWHTADELHRMFFGAEA